MTPQQQRHIEQMTHEDLCRYWRFGSSHPLLTNLDLEAQELIRKRLFNGFGGFTPELSKKIGW